MKFKKVENMQNVIDKIYGMKGDENIKTESADISMQDSNIQILSRIMNKKCKKCSSFKPPASHHCSTCERCIARMDHHCPWVNNCVGFYNQKFFLQFLIYVALGSVHALVLIAWQSFLCMEQNCVIMKYTHVCILAGISIFLAVLFALFVIITFCDQMSCILYNTSTIDNLAKEKNPNAEADKGQNAWCATQRLCR